MNEYDVAVVVYCRAEGVDFSDAQSRAERALLDFVLTFNGAELPNTLSPEVQIAGFSGLSHAHVTLSPDSTAYRRAGMGPVER